MGGLRCVRASGDMMTVLAHRAHQSHGVPLACRLHAAALVAVLLNCMLARSCITRPGSCAIKLAGSASTCSTQAGPLRRTRGRGMGAGRRTGMIQDKCWLYTLLLYKLAHQLVEQAGLRGRGRAFDVVLGALLL